MGERWNKYIQYLRQWVNDHEGMQFAGCSPACFDEWLDNEDEDEDETENGGRLMSKAEAFNIIAKHIYVARRMYAGDKTIIILAYSLNEAKEKAFEYFGTQTNHVNKLDSTDDPQVFEI